VVFLTKAVVRLSTATVQSAIDQSPTVIAIGRDAGVQAISTAQVEAMPSVGEADVFRTLQMLPSVAGAGNGGASLSVRGGTPDQNLVLLDGITVYHVDHFFGLFSAFNTDALKDIQLYAGGFPARYGGRVSSVIDLTGKAGDERHFRASGGASLLSARGVVEIPLGRGSLLLSGRRSYTDVIKSGLYNRLFDFARQGSSAQTRTQVGFGGGGRGVGRFTATAFAAFFRRRAVGDKHGRAGIGVSVLETGPPVTERFFDFAAFTAQQQKIISSAETRLLQQSIRALPRALFKTRLHDPQLFHVG
jgi:hypothetical protein